MSSKEKKSLTMSFVYCEQCISFSNQSAGKFEQYGYAAAAAAAMLAATPVGTDIHRITAGMRHRLASELESYSATHSACPHRSIPSSSPLPSEQATSPASPSIHPPQTFPRCSTKSDENHHHTTTNNTAYWSGRTNYRPLHTFETQTSTLSCTFQSTMHTPMTTTTTTTTTTSTSTTSTAYTPTYYALRHGCRHFHSTFIPDPTSKKKTAKQHPARDEHGFVDLETFQADHDPRYGKKAHRNGVSWSPSRSEEAQLIRKATLHKRHTHDSSALSLGLSTPGAETPSTDDDGKITLAASSGNTTPEKHASLGGPSTEPIPVKYQPSRDSAATTSEGDNMQGPSTKEAHSIVRNIHGPIALKPADKKRHPRSPATPPPVPRPVACTGCTHSLLGTTAYACNFPTCHVLVCPRCADLLTHHYDEGGVDGSLGNLKRRLVIERGGPEAAVLLEEERKEAENRARLKRCSAIGANWVRLSAERNRERQEFENRWGRRLE